MLPKRFPIAVKTLPHLEPLLAAEMQHLGAWNVLPAKRVVHAEVNLEGLYKLNYCLRSGLRILVPIAEFQIRDVDDIYRNGLKVNWDQFLSVNQTFAIDPNVHSRMIRHEHFASLRLKDALVDFFNQKMGNRPSVKVEKPDVLFHLHIDEHKVTISLDSSGEGLNRRGYRRSGAMAPLNEVLAAGMILLTGWHGETDFYDTMCGSGTLPIEAWSIARNMPVQVNRKFWGFLTWNNFEPEVWERVKAEALAESRPLSVRIFASDASERAVSIAKQNMREAGCEKEIEVTCEDFFLIAPHKEEGIMVLNPPYGERIDVEQLTLFYKKIGDAWKKNWPGFTAWIISSNIDSLKNLGLRASRRLDLMNGPLVCKYFKYELFKGTKHPRPEATETPAE